MSGDGRAIRESGCRAAALAALEEHATAGNVSTIQFFRWRQLAHEGDASATLVLEELARLEPVKPSADASGLPAPETSRRD